MPICTRCGTGYDDDQLSCPSCGRAGSSQSSFFSVPHSACSRFSLQIALFVTLLALLINFCWGIYRIIKGELWAGLMVIAVGTPYLYAQMVVFADVLKRL